MPGKPEMVEPTLWNGKVKNERSGVTGVHYGSSSSRHSSGSASSVNVSLSLLQSAKGVPGVVPDKQSSSYDKVSDHGKGVPKSEGFRAGNRQNPWQTQWMSRSSEQARDVFTCVWCRESFRSLAEMTVHMKQSPRCGMAGMQSSIPSTSPTPPSTTAANSTQPAHQQPTTSKSSSASSTSSSSASGSSSVLVKESMPLPRKLVRGQDVWLGKGAEQTRQILKCMWCGQSFKSLADMTTHMRVTQHYTNIISQEQIISWRTPEDKMTAQSQLNAVLTCKVCDQAFGSLKELTYHMVKNSHYKEHILRSITEGGGRRRQTRERRKKSLPVRKLLELERMELHKHTPKSSNQNHALSPSKSEAAFGTITCEECAEKVDAKDFVQHIKSCGQGSKSQQLLKSALLSQASSGGKSSTMEGTGNCSSASVTPNSVSSASQDMHGEDSQSSKHPATEMTEPESEKPCDGEGETPGTTSVLNAIEKLIEKSFDSKGRRGGAPSAGILQRLGIDEEVCPPWHTSGSPNTLGVIRNGADMSLRQTTLSPSALRVTDFKDRSNGSMSDAGCRSPTSSTSSLMDEQNEPGGLGISQSSVPNTLYLPSTQERQHRSSSRLTPHSKPSSPQLPTNLVVNQICKTSQEDDEGADSPESTRPASVDNPTCLTVKTRSYDATSHQESESSKVSPRGAKDGSAERASSEAGEMDDVTSSADAAVEKSDVADSTAEQSNKFDRPSSGSGRKSSESPCDSLSALRVKSPAESGSHANTGEAVSSATSSGSDPPPNHPLRELQKLLDKTDAHLSRPNPQTSPGSILAFSWACSDAATSDSLMKCAFCETHFISKGAYRHHLSKMHFIKDGNVADSPTWKATQSGTTAATTTTTSKTNSEVVSPKGSPSSSQEESPHTKFLKYTELAKQLSSKYV